jgi:ABC-type bacteriocin/lantibiotic exporter with double-glycine peptidase domain
MRYPIVLQQSEEDCGAACLATVAQYHGRHFSIGRIRELAGTRSRGTSLLGLSRGAESLGFQVRQVKATPQLLDHLDQVPLPAIVHWQGYHWMVLYGKNRRNQFIVADPSIGLRYLSEVELMSGWTNGAMLMLNPSAAFDAQPEDKRTGFGQFVRRVWPDRGLLVQAIGLNVVIGLLALASPLMMQLLTDDVLVRGDTQLLLVVALGVVGMTLVRSVINLIQAQLIGYFGQRLQLGLVMEYGQKLLRLPLSYFEGRRSGEIVSRIADVSAVHSLVAQLVLGLPSQFFIAAISLVLMLAYSWELTLASTVMFAILIAVNFLFLPAIRQKTRNLIIQSTENQGFLVETVQGVQVLKTTQATQQAWQEYQGNFSRLAHLGWGAMKLELYSGTVTGVLSSFVSVGLLGLGSYLVINQRLTVGQLLAYNGMSGNFFGFWLAAIGIVDEFIRAQVILQRLGEVMDATPEDEQDAAKTWVELPASADIYCEKLRFHHSGRVDLLQDLDLVIPGGCMTALIGRSGCGKSTLVKLLSGLYQLRSGNIRYGIYNQSEMPLDCLRQQVVLVPQEAHFWSRSILDNLRFSYPQASLAQIIQACEIAGADEFIQQLPDQYQTVLGEFGANLSGGQRQRLAIARALLANPPILILDESTAALDPWSEAMLLERLQKHRRGQTTLLISHRPQVIERCDWVVMLEQGKVVCQGVPEDLRQREARYRSFLVPELALHTISQPY